MLRLTFCVFLLCISGLNYAAESPDYRKKVFNSEFPYESKFTKINGHKIHFIDEGQGQVFLFLHGNPSSIYLWRNVMRYVAPKGRIVAMDNIGFGKSEQPEDLDYTFQTHYDYVEKFIQQQKLKKVILVIHDWGSVLGLNYAMLNSKNVRGLVFMEAIVPPKFPMDSVAEFGPAASMFEQFRNPETGKQVLIEQNAFIEKIMVNASLTRKMSETEKDVYRAPFKDKSKRYPIFMWPNELPIGGHPARNVKVIEDIGKWLEKSKTPKLLQYVSPGALVSPESAQWMAENYRNIETQFVGYGIHFIQEDNPQAIGRGIADWYRRNFE